MFRKAILPVLLLLLLPACGVIPPLTPPPTPAPQISGEDLFQEAEAAYRQQAYAGAYQRYEAYLERFPQGPRAMEARLRRADLLGLQGDWYGALRHYQGLLAREPAPDIVLKARYGLGRAYFKLGQYQQAVQVLDALTALDLPRSLWFSTQTLLAEIALKQGNVSQAFARLRLAAPELPSGDQEWFDDLKTRLTEAARPEELERLATLYRDDPLSAPLLLRLANLARDAGRLEEAKKWRDTLQERFPNSPEAAAAARLSPGSRPAVGALLPLSGELTHIGNKVKQGLELAAADSGVDLVFRDTRNGPGAVAGLVQELAQEQSLLAIVGPLTAGVAQAAAEAAQTQGLPLITLSQKDGLSGVGPYIFQAFLTPGQQVRGLLSQTMGAGMKRYAVLYPDTPYGHTFAEAFQEEVAARGGELAAQETYLPGTRDFSGALAALGGEAAAGRSHFQALFVPDEARAVAAVAARLGPDAGVQLLGTNLLHTANLPPEQLQSLEGVLFPDAFFAGDPNAAVQQFVAAYRQKYGEEPDYLATQGYVAGRLLVRLLTSGKPLSRAQIPGQLLALPPSKDLPWFKGFNQERQEEGALYLLTFSGGQVQMLAVARE
jgi:ABC-type branched-subunit amino acid transport system substrate-binding protein